MAQPYNLTPQQTLEEFKSDIDKGLTNHQVQENLKIYGPNAIPPKPPTSFLTLLLKQFEDLLVLILLGAAFISFILALLEDPEDQLTAFMEPLVILIILICNAAVGVIQETNAEEAIEKLKEMDASEAKVVREGNLITVDPAELVPGDIVLISNGDKVPADLRLIRTETATLSVDESPLTGEPNDVRKDTAVMKKKDVVLQDTTNILYRSTLVTKGKGVGIVVKTGERTAIGKIQSSLQEDDEERTPLQKKLDDFGELLSKIILGICITVWLINIQHFTDSEHGGALKGAVYYFKIAVALAVAAIPEGLPAVVTTCLALGTRKMAQKNAIVRSLPSVETLGCTSVICSDKTGTLTTNKMSTTRVLLVSKDSKPKIYKVECDGWAPIGKIDSNPVPTYKNAFGLLGMITSLCNDAKIMYDDKKNMFTKIGESTEAALKAFTEKIGVPDAKLNSTYSKLPLNEKGSCASKFWASKYERQFTLEFSRDRKAMSVVVCDRQTKDTRLCVKGAPESILFKCTKYVTEEGEIRELDENIRDDILSTLEMEFAQKEGLRCLAMAFVDNPKYSAEKYRNPVYYSSIETDMIFTGVTGMLDPPRPEVKAALQTCNNAGIRVIVITGDLLSTAISICRSIGVFTADEDVKGKAFSGTDFYNMSEDEQKKVIRSASLFARVEPLHKKRIVDLLRADGEIVAMTGDGVNDAPALKEADIGIAMGTGTAVARDSSDMILQDDNFATIVMAVEEGRAIYANTKQFIRYLISSNIGEVCCIFFTAAIGMPEALIPVQLLWVNFVTDGLPATALGFNKPDKDIMTQKPRGYDDQIIDGWMMFRYTVIGVYVGIATVGGFIWWYLYYPEGPLVTYEQLTSFHMCRSADASVDFSGVDCDIFKARSPSTVSLSILVIIEMFNTFNALSENQSLFVVYPWDNIWVVLAVILSIALHVGILYVQFFQDIFSVAPLNYDEWVAVFLWSFPVIILDEILKFLTRLKASAELALRKKNQ